MPARERTAISGRVVICGGRAITGDHFLHGTGEPGALVELPLAAPLEPAVCARLDGAGRITAIGARLDLRRRWARPRGPA